MKEKPNIFADPILEAFYQYKAEYPTKLISLQELRDYLNSYNTQIQHTYKNLIIPSPPSECSEEE